MKWFKRGLLAIVLVLASYGGYRLIPERAELVNVYYATNFAKAPYGVVGFPSFNARSGVDFANGAVDAVRQNSGGTLVLPQNASAENKVPAMIILHGSNGDWSGRSQRVASLAGPSIH